MSLYNFGVLFYSIRFEVKILGIFNLLSVLPKKTLFSIPRNIYLYLLLLISVNP